MGRFLDFDVIVSLVPFALLILFTGWIYSTKEIGEKKSMGRILLISLVVLAIFVLGVALIWYFGKLFIEALPVWVVVAILLLLGIWFLGLLIFGVWRGFQEERELVRKGELKKAEFKMGWYVGGIYLCALIVCIVLSQILQWNAIPAWSVCALWLLLGIGFFALIIHVTSLDSRKRKDLRKSRQAEDNQKPMSSKEVDAHQLEKTTQKIFRGAKMFERFTDRARRVMALANQEAHRLNHEYIGTEHLLLGLVQEAGPVSAKVLKDSNIDEPRVGREIEKLVKPGLDIPIPPDGRPLPQTPRTKNAIKYAIEEAQSLQGNYYVGTEHMLLGLLRETDGVANKVLTTLGLELKDVRKKVLNLLDDSSEK